MDDFAPGVMNVGELHINTFAVESCHGGHLGADRLLGDWAVLLADDAVHPLCKGDAVILVQYRLADHLQSLHGCRQFGNGPCWADLAAGNTV